jgi:glycerol-3-phosphate dehydrogenase (NAD(P)+)
MKKTIAIIGAGEIGSCLGKILEKLGHQVYLWDILPEKSNTQKTLEEIVRDAEFVFLATPSWSLPEALGSVKNYLRPETKIICLSKGMGKTGKTVSEIIKETVVNDFVIFSGPMIAEELNLGLPGFSVVAGKEELFKDLKELFNGSVLHLKYSSDLKAVAYAGILKNIYAIILGIADGLDYGDNVKGFLATEIFEEWGRLAKICDFNIRELAGWAGVGDFIATSMSQYSKNRELGEKLAKSRQIDLKSEGLESLEPIIKIVREKNNNQLPKYLEALEKIIIKKQNAKTVFEELVNI